MGVSKPAFTCKYQKFSLRVLLLSICLIFCEFQHNVAYKSVAYKKKRAVMFSSKVWFIVIYVEPSRSFNRVFCFSFPNAVKPKKLTPVHS